MIIHLRHGEAAFDLLFGRADADMIVRFELFRTPLLFILFGSYWYSEELRRHSWGDAGGASTS